MWGLFLQFAPDAGTHLQNSLLLYDVLCWVCEPQLSYVDANLAVLFRVLLLMQTHLCAAKVKLTISLSMWPVLLLLRIAFTRLAHVSCLEWNLLLETCRVTFG